ncbi:MAG: hypothetical protein D6706_02855 [Chloroflexi bacterium]|nr:MAG: hypothetical protein D6706_02855 [Chloroflexota bacterium]
MNLPLSPMTWAEKRAVCDCRWEKSAFWSFTLWLTCVRPDSKIVFLCKGGKFLMTEQDDRQTLVDRIASALGETAPGPLKTIARVVKVVGAAKALALLEETRRIEATGGMLTDDGRRRRTPGGVFFKLVKNQTTSRERGKIFGPPPGRIKVPKPAEVVQLARSILIHPKGEAMTVKITLIGHPGRIVEKDAVVITAMQSSHPPSLPRGLPQPPATSTNYVVFIARKQWQRVKDSLVDHPDDRLIIEGYPVFDSRLGPQGAITVYARYVTTQQLQQARRRSEK